MVIMRFTQAAVSFYLLQEIVTIIGEYFNCADESVQLRLRITLMLMAATFAADHAINPSKGGQHYLYQ